MKYQVIGDTDNPLVEVTLDADEVIKVENGGMCYMQNVELEGKLNASTGGIGGFFKAVGRSMVSGESMFMTYARGVTDGARIGIAPSTPGCIRTLSVGDQQYRLNNGAFLACDNTINYNVVSQKSFGKALLGGTGGFFVMETEGYGNLLINAFGDMIEMEVTDSSPLIIDNEHVVAWDIALDYEIKPASGVIGFKSGEGFVNEFHGNGKVLIQTRNIHNLANQLIPYMPTSSSSD
jgi:uncharacterized protein (TIGR00266 family)